MKIAKACAFILFASSISFVNAARIVGSTSSSVTLSISTASSCVFEGNALPEFDMADDYNAASFTTAAQGDVTVYAYCNHLTPITNRTLTGSTGTSTIQAGKNNGVLTTLTKDVPGPVGPNNSLIVKVWYIVGNTKQIMTGDYKGATRYATQIKAGYTAPAQFGASSGDYKGQVSFKIEF